jgi:hypothetical protein
MQETHNLQSKLPWSPPAIAVYGDVEKITLQGQAKLKVLGSQDDFGITGISDA